MDDYFSRFSFYEFQGLIALICVTATVILLFWEKLFQSNLEKRVKDLYLKRERLRKQERERLEKVQETLSGSMKSTPLFERLTSSFSLIKRSEDENIALPLMRAGLRGRAPVIAYLAVQLILPPILFIVSVLYLNTVLNGSVHFIVIILLSIFVALLSREIPKIFLKNRTIKRQAEILKFWPDTLDVLLLSVQAGMSVESAFRTVSQEIGVESPVISEEIRLTLAELSFLQNRVQAYRNLEKRTDLENVRSVVTVLVQSERYGTSMAQGLRSLAQDGRNARMAAAEKKAAALPPRLTVPMIVFFLPVLFVIIMTPAILQVLSITN